jgi:hypothetical protein
MARTLPLPSWARRSKRGNVSFAPGVDTRPDYRARSASLWRRAPHRVHPTPGISCEAPIRSGFVSFIPLLGGADLHSPDSNLPLVRPHDDAVSHLYEETVAGYLI